MKANQSEFLKEARRCAYEASKGVSPGRSQMFSGLALFYKSLAETEPPRRREPKHREHRANEKAD